MKHYDAWEELRKRLESRLKKAKKDVIRASPDPGEIGSRLYFTNRGVEATLKSVISMLEDLEEEFE